MLYQVRKGYVFTGKNVSHILKEGEIVDSNILKVDGQMHKIEPVKEKKAAENDAGNSGKPGATDTTGLPAGTKQDADERAG